MIRNTFGSKELACDAVKAGDRAFAQLVEGRTNRYLLLTLSATLTITASVSAIVGLGSLAQIFDYIGIDRGGDDIQVHPLFWLAISNWLSQSDRTATRVTSLSASPVQLVEQIVIPFEYLGGANPGETRFRENDIKLRTRVFYQLNGVNNGIANLVTGGTAALSNITVNVEQYFDDDKTAKPPLYRPWWKTLILPVAGANTEAFIDLDLDDLCRGITILQNTANKGMVSDIIQGIGLRSSNTNYIGAGQMLNFAQWARGMEFKSGGNVWAAAQGGLVHINLQESGRLSHCLNPTQDKNFRLYFNCAPSGVSGATGSEIRILLHTLERKAVQRDDGLFITAPDSDPRFARLALSA